MQSCAMSTAAGWFILADVETRTCRVSGEVRRVAGPVGSSTVCTSGAILINRSQIVVLAMLND